MRQLDETVKRIVAAPCASLRKSCEELRRSYKGLAEGVATELRSPVAAPPHGGINIHNIKNIATYIYICAKYRNIYIYIYIYISMISNLYDNILYQIYMMIDSILYTI